MSDVVLAGGGLANCLIAWQLRLRRPDLQVTLLEQGASLGGNHTWSFHAGDVEAPTLDWLRPLVVHEWPAQTVRFPGFTRRLGTPYYSLTSDRLHEVVAPALGAGLRLGVDVAELGPDGVTLASGERLPASLVVDGRGALPLEDFDLGWQKFLGLEVELDGPHGIEVPLLMDATVAQRGGYRFMYVLPTGASRLLLEDTYYSESPELSREELRRQIAAYAAGCGWTVARVLREETGVLPIVLDGDPRRYWDEADPAVPRSGMRALLFHHTTGYSLPDAARLAEDLAGLRRLESRSVAAWIRERSLASWRRQGFFRLLNRLMFEAAEPGLRYRTLAHFYRAGEPLIARFYAGRLGALDRLRLLTGRPPVPVGRALGCLLRGLVARPARAPGSGP